MSFLPTHSLLFHFTLIEGVAETERTNRSGAFGMTLEMRGYCDFRKLLNIPNRQYNFCSLFIIKNNRNHKHYNFKKQPRLNSS